MSDLGPGTRVRFWPGWRDYDRSYEGVVEYGPMMLGGHTEVVYIRRDDGKNVGAVAMTHVEAIVGPNAAREDR